MKVFPSKNEKLITTAVIGFVLGLSVGLLSALEMADTKDLIPSLAALFAAFFGAYTAFFLESRSRKHEKRVSQLDAANQLLYVLFERLNTVKLFQIDFVEPVRDDPGRMLSLQPMANYHAPESKMEADKIAYLFQTSHKGLMFELHVVNEQFHEAVNSIRHRSNLHLNVCQPLLEQAGHRTGDAITEKDVLNAIGERNYEMLRQSTDIVIENVDKFVERADKLRARLILVFSEIFTKDEVFWFELLDRSLK